MSAATAKLREAFAHILDDHLAGKAGLAPAVAALEAALDAVAGSSDSESERVRAVARRILEALPACLLAYEPGDEPEPTTDEERLAAVTRFLRVVRQERAAFDAN